MRRWAKLVVFAATLATLWLVAFPAMASGPLCDDRGATAIAPTPAAMHAEQSLLALDDDDCDHDAHLPAVQRHRAPAEAITFAEADSALPTNALRVFASPADAPLATYVAEAPRAGVRLRVDRPPRG